MVAPTTLHMSDLSRQRRFETQVGDRLAPDHSVGHAVDYYLERMRIPDNGLRWTAFSRGVKLDNKQPLSDLPVEDSDWTVMPEVSAG